MFIIKLKKQKKNLTHMALNAIQAFQKLSVRVIVVVELKDV